MSLIANPIVGYSGNIVESDAASKAIRTIAYDVNGDPINPFAGHSYLQSWNCQIGQAAPGSNASIFHIRNSPDSTKDIFIKRLRIGILTVTQVNPPHITWVELIRTSSGNMSGGSTVTVANCGRKDTASPDPSFSDLRYSTNMVALTTTGVVFGQQLGIVCHHCSIQRVEVEYRFNEYDRPLVLTPGQGLALRNAIAIPVNMEWSVGGEICWDEI